MRPAKAIAKALPASALRSSLPQIQAERTCGAKLRSKPGLCKIWRSTFRCKNGNYRCRFHAGLSTGPKTAFGKMRSFLNLLPFVPYKANSVPRA